MTNTSDPQHEEAPQEDQQVETDSLTAPEAVQALCDVLGSRDPQEARRILSATCILLGIDADFLEDGDEG